MSLNHILRVQKIVPAVQIVVLTRFIFSRIPVGAREKKRIAGSRDCLYPRIANGSSVSPYRERILCILCIANGSSVSCVSPMDPPYPRYIFYILIALSTSPVATTCSNCILNSSQILYCGVPLGLQVLYYRDTLGFSSTILWEYP